MDEKYLSKILSDKGNVYSMYNKGKYNFLELRTKKDMSKDEKKIIDLITIKKDILPVGSFRFKAHQYPGDIDIMEKFEKCCTLNDVRFSFMRQIQEIIKKINETKNIFLGDFKAGYDQRYDVYIGKIIDGEIIDYQKEIAEREIENLKNQDLIDESEYIKMMNLITVVPSLEDFSKLYNMLRDKYLLRWNEKEILQGYIERRGNKKIWLYDALINGSIIKLDIWAPIDNRYVEVTNWFLVIKKGFNGKSKFLSAEFDDYIEALTNDIIVYRNDNPMKSAKRLWNLSHFIKDYSTMKKLYKLFSSFPALLYQIKGDITVIKELISTYNNVDINFINSEINDFKTRVKPKVNKYLTLSEKTKLYLLIDNIIFSNLSETSINLFIQYLSKIINYYTEKYFELYDINPIDYIKSNTFKTLSKKSPTPFKDIESTCPTEFLK
jgi:hypothetical protein